MAKRYIRINWQNAPSVATPRNAENLNIMDKGIDDLDLYKIDTDAIANNLVTTEAGLVLDARQGKVLDDKVNTINNYLTNLLFNKAIPNVSGSYTTADDLPLGVVYCTTQLTNMPFPNSIIFTLGIAGLNKVQIAFTFNAGGNANMYKRICTSSGVWQGWYAYNGVAV